MKLLGALHSAYCTLRVLIVCTASGCAVIPWPHMANTTPKVRGSINSDGKPAVEMQVRVAAGNSGDPCAGQSVDAVTGQGGEFEVEPSREVRLLAVVMAHTVYPWSLCYRDGGRWIALVSEREYSLADTGPVGTMVARCELAAASVPRCEIASLKD